MELCEVTTLLSMFVMFGMITMQIISLWNFRNRNITQKEKKLSMLRS